MFENVDNGRTTDAWLYFKLTFEPKGSGGLIQLELLLFEESLNTDLSGIKPYCW